TQPGTASFTAGAGTVSTANSTINIGNGTGLQTGDQVTYDNETHAGIGGLTQNGQYFARIVNGLLSLYDIEAPAVAGGNTPPVHLASTGPGTQQFTFYL